MFYQQYTPHPALRNYVKCYWIMESEDCKWADQKEKILPDGCMEMVFHYHDLYRQFKHGQEKIQSRNLIVGQLKDYIEIAPTGKTGMIAVRFQPHGAYPFIQTPMNELTEEAVDLQLVLKDTSEIQEKIWNAHTNGERVSIVEKFLLDRISGIDPGDQRIHVSVNYILKHHGNLSIRQLCDMMNLSERQLERIFTARVGLSPKALSRIVRLQYTLQLVQQKQVNNYTDLAYQSGYYDQAHLIREFKSFSGVNPSQYFAENYQYASFFSAPDN